MTAALRPTTRAGRANYKAPRRTINHGTARGYEACKCAICRAGNAARRAEQRSRLGRQESLGPRSTPGAVRCSCGQVCATRTALGKHCWAAPRQMADRRRTHHHHRGGRVSAQVANLLRCIQGAHDLLCIRFGPSPSMEPAATRNYSNEQLAAMVAANAAELLAVFTDEAA